MRMSASQEDAVKELVNIGIGQASGILNEMLQTHIGLRVPEVTLTSAEEYCPQAGEGERVSALQLGFEGGFDGSATLVFPRKDAAKLVSGLTGEEYGPEDLDSLTAGTLCEVGNIVLNSVIGAMSNVLHQTVLYSLPY